MDKKKLVLMTSALMAIGLLAGCGNNHVHNWGEVVYEWSADHTSCTATRVCEDDESHVETETKDSVYAVTKEAKCEEDGSGRYTVTFDNEAFGTAHFVITLEAIGHEWGEATYTWSDDNSTCTATRVCAHDATHVDTETVNSTYVVVEEAKCEADGVGRYTADFASEAFVDQTKDITLEAIGHVLTAHESHAETCTEAGNIEYWSCDVCGKYFSDEEGKNEIDAESIIIPAHHTLEHHAKEPESCTEPGIIEYWHCTVCGNDFYDEAATRQVESEDDLIIPAHHVLTHHDAKDATCTEAGNHEYYSCDVCGKIFQDANAEISLTPGEEIIEATGHSWGTPTYEWNDDMTECTATRVCNNDASHIETETVSASVGVITDEDGDTPGTIGGAAIFENSAFEPQSNNKNIFEFKKNDDGQSYALTKFIESTLSEPVTLPSTINDLPVTNISDECFTVKFLTGSNITSVTIPNSIVSIGQYAFSYTKKLSSVTFENGSKLELIGNSAFYSSVITELTIPASVVTLDEWCFGYCQSLGKIYFEENSKLTTIGGRVFENDKNITHLDNIPSSVESIGERAFYCCGRITTVVLPAGITSIGESAFYQCYNLRTIDFGGTIEQWNAVSKGNQWNYKIEATVVHCSDGDVTL